MTCPRHRWYAQADGTFVCLSCRAVVEFPINPAIPPAPSQPPPSPIPWSIVAQLLGIFIIGCTLALIIVVIVCHFF